METKFKCPNCFEDFKREINDEIDYEDNFPSTERLIVDGGYMFFCSEECTDEYESFLITF